MEFQNRVILPLCAAALLCGGGCAAMQKTGPKDDAMEAAFEAQRSEQSKMSSFAASARKKGSGEEEPAGRGEMFLLSDKAKEIYANTER